MDASGILAQDGVSRFARRTRGTKAFSGNRNLQPFVEGHAIAMRFVMRILAALAALMPLPAQHGEVGFSAEVQVVNVFATVRDRDGRILTGLGMDDFVLWEDGLVQDIAYFAYETDVPLKI